ncbi:MAG: hypothetical protein A2X86_07830 [Bdellovibrionales bacterium GWA2_49_15]|nr:MAG: hypothetical protein A2X86_07830 [Bdellovibrionales bacterium GWA2_49_15]HAZ11812.1 hypothetical protein [Bdellovibrionales bacterium]
MKKQVSFACLIVCLGLSSTASFANKTPGHAVKPAVQAKADLSEKKSAPKSPEAEAAQRKENDEITKRLLTKFLAGFKDKKDLDAFNKEVRNTAGRAVPALIEVMKNAKYPDKSRWLATFMLGRAMGKKAAPFIGKFTAHPSWVMRLAALKVLLALKQHEMVDVYARTLRDDSMIVRTQALANVRDLKLDKLAPNVWAMLYDKRNYYEAKKATKRSNIIKEVITAVGELRFEKARDPLLTMIQKDKYSDVFEEINKSLEKITGQDAPKGDRQVKRHYWSRYVLTSKTI